jgi:hypothetical protein
MTVSLILLVARTGIEPVTRGFSIAIGKVNSLIKWHLQRG